MTEALNIATNLLSGVFGVGGGVWLLRWLFKRNQTATDQAYANSNEALLRVGAMEVAVEKKLDTSVYEAAHCAQEGTLDLILKEVTATRKDMKDVGERVANIEGRLNGGPK